MVFDLEEKYTAAAAADDAVCDAVPLPTDADGMAGECMEIFDLIGLKNWQRTGRDHNAGALAKYIRQHDSSPTPSVFHPGRMECTVPYFRRYNIPGRWYAGAWGPSILAAKLVLSRPLEH